MDFPLSGHPFLLHSYTQQPPDSRPSNEHPGIADIFSHDYVPLSLPFQVQEGFLSGPAAQPYSGTATLHQSDFNEYHTFSGLIPNINATTPQSQPSPSSDPANSLVGQSMPPPTQSRKRKAPTLHGDDWEPVKARVIELHIEQKLPLPKVKEIVEEEFKPLGFNATSVQPSVYFDAHADVSIKHSSIQITLEPVESR
jgi:hypothetical protein